MGGEFRLRAGAEMEANVRTVFAGKADGETMVWVRIPPGAQLGCRPGSPGELGNDLSAVAKIGESRSDSTTVGAIRQRRWAGPPAILDCAQGQTKILAADEIGTQKRPELPGHVQ